METIVCKLCLETVTNSICADCLLVGVKKWLQSKAREDLLLELQEKHDNIKELTNSSQNGIVCIKCRNWITEAVCPCCYLREIHLWLSEINTKIAQEFEELFNFDFYHHHSFTQLTLMESIAGKSVLRNQFIPVIISQHREKFDENICEICGNVADSLTNVNGEFICENCKDEF